MIGPDRDKSKGFLTKDEIEEVQKQEVIGTRKRKKQIKIVLQIGNRHNDLKGKQKLTIINIANK